MSHRHGVFCPTCDFEGSGQVYDFCGADDCEDPHCVPLGHCTCLCHSGRQCVCGHTWPYMNTTPR